MYTTFKFYNKLILFGVHFVTIPLSNAASMLSKTFLYWQMEQWTEIAKIPFFTVA